MLPQYVHSGLWARLAGWVVLKEAGKDVSGLFRLQ